MKNQTAVTVTFTEQVGPDDYSQVSVTKVFYLESTLEKIRDWVKSKNKTGDFVGVKFTDIES